MKERCFHKPLTLRTKNVKRFVCHYYLIVNNCEGKDFFSEMETVSMG
jgi:hypothetical protein